MSNKFLNVEMKNLGHFQLMRFFGGGGKLTLGKLEFFTLSKVKDLYDVKSLAGRKKSWYMSYNICPC